MLNEIDLSRADLNLLTLFAVVLEERHVGRAAARLNLTASAVSHGLGRLRRLLNDPLFLRTPKGVVPTARALELAEPIADVLVRARRVIGSSAPFAAATSRRRFAIGAPDGAAAVFLPPLLADLGRLAPGVDVSVRHIHRDTALAELDARAVDLAIVPVDDIPARFVARMLYEDDFVIAMRVGHSFARHATLERYCAMSHLIVSLTGDTRVYVDDVLAKRGLSRRVALTVPNFMLALAIISETDHIAALPRALLTMHGKRFGVRGVEPPLSLRRFQLRCIAPKAAMMDAGLAWFFDVLEHSVRKQGARRPASRPG
jgi:DNA-binding transcriptional LysR family regulator